jgi:hypothetical protein
VWNSEWEEDFLRLKGWSNLRMHDKGDFVDAGRTIDAKTLEME